MSQKLTRLAVLGLAMVLPLCAIAADRKGHSGDRDRDVGRQSRAITTRRVVQADIRRAPAPKFVQREQRERHERSSLGAGRRDRDGDRSFHYSHRRHFWHNRWWVYGVGPCWAYSNRWDEYYWTCGDDD